MTPRRETRVPLNGMRPGWLRFWTIVVWAGVLLAAALIFAVPLLAGGIDHYDPHRFSATRPDGYSVTLCGTNAIVCHMVGEALRAGRWVPLGEPDMRGAAMRCERERCFPAGHECIAGYNCR